MALGARRIDREGAFAGTDPQRAIIDIGSNTVRLVLYGGSARAPNVVFNERVVARLGRDMEGGRLNPEAMAIALRALRRFALILEDLGVADVETVATAAVREASNRDEFLREVRDAGLDPHVLPGEEEARLSAMGVAGAFPGAQGVVADLGGGSLELIGIDGDDIGAGVSLPLGTLRLAAYQGAGFAETVASLREVLAKSGWSAPRDMPLYLVGGTWRALAAYVLDARQSMLTDPHGLSIEREDARHLARAIAEVDSAALQANPRISSERAELLPLAGPLLAALLDTLQPDRLVVSAWGLREGVLYDRLLPEQRSQDPLLAAVAEFANMRGCPPTLAARMTGWTVNAMPRGWPGSERIRLAATSLALASMQIEPNFRLGVATDWALQKRWLDISDEDRALMAACVAANGNRCDLADALSALARPERIRAAIAWGLAVRLARRLGGRSRASLTASRLSVADGTLLLELAESRQHLNGLPTEKDMALLADHLGCKPRVEVVPDAAVSVALD